LETWYDWLGFVPRPRLGNVVPMIGDRRFASIIQKYLHEYGEIVIANIEIVAPYDEDPKGHPRVRARQLRFKMAEAQMPGNIKNFNKFKLRFATNDIFVTNSQIFCLLTFPVPIRLLLIIWNKLNFIIEIGLIEYPH
jgi:hypothetical protein